MKITFLKLLILVLFMQINQVIASSRSSGAVKLTVNDLSILFPAKAMKQLPHPKNFLSKKQYNELTVTFEEKEVCIAGLRIDPSSALKTNFMKVVKRGEKTMVAQLPLEILSVERVPSFRLIIQDCEIRFDLAAHILFKISEEEIEKFLVNSILLREKFSIFLDDNLLAPRNDLDEDSDVNSEYLKEFSSLLNSFVTQNTKIHRIASMKSNIFLSEWGFRVVDIDFDAGFEKHKMAVVPNIPTTSLNDESFQQSILSLTNLAHDDEMKVGYLASNFLSKNYIDSIVGLVKNQYSTSVSAKINNLSNKKFTEKSFLPFPDEIADPIHERDKLFAFPIPNPQESNYFLSVDEKSSPLFKNGVDHGANPAMVNPGNTDCLSCHISPTLSENFDQVPGEFFNTGHFRWINDIDMIEAHPAISKLVENETLDILNQLRPVINSALGEIRKK
ncbi:MAG: hypothetical protein H6621_05275 [Halobacteriovoraceae bacterium]|nr:hypothetical protein [Halobacteriovoraceae bacterium]